MSESLEATEVVPFAGLCVIDCGGQNPRYRLGPEVLMKSSAAAHVVYMQVHAMLMAAHAWPWSAAEDQAC